MLYAPHVRGGIKLPIYRLAPSQSRNTDDVTTLFWGKIKGLLKPYCEARNYIKNVTILDFFKFFCV